MNVSVIGTGYVGLVSGACLAEKGHRVVCVDKEPQKVEKINAAVSPIYENGLDELLKRNVPERLTATSDLDRAVRETEISLIAVGTPFDGERIDLSYIREAAAQIGRSLKEKDGYHVVVVKSTVVPGTTEELVLSELEKASGKRAGRDFGVGMNPEFLREGEAVFDFMSPDRIVLGGIDERTLDTLQDLYRPFEGVDAVRTTPKTAEMVKYAANSLLATLISFSNEIGNLCAALGGIDAVDVMKGVHLDKRLSPILPTGERIRPSIISYLESGCGFGGSCFPKDVKALIAHGKAAGRPMPLLEAVIGINERQPQRVLDLCRRHLPNLKGAKVAVLGLAFKPGTEDMRESPAIPVVRGLLEQEARIRAYDPVARQEADKLFNDARIVYCDTLEQTLQEAQVVLLLTRWEEFRRIPELLRKMDPVPLFIDGRRMLDKNSVARYAGIGM